MQALVSNQAIDAISGRVTKIAATEAGGSVRILTQPENGRATVDPDGTTVSYVSRDPGFEGAVSLELEISHADGRVEIVETEIDLAPSVQLGGWATGENLYMLRTDAADEVVVETGDNHRKVYVSGSEDALTMDDIREIEGVEVGDRKFGKWLAEHGEYGATEDMALAPDAAMALWDHITGGKAGPNSNWLLFERGYDYAVGNMIRPGTKGESELHPVHITAWGEGEAPLLTEKLTIRQNPSENVVISDLAFDRGVQGLGGSNIIFEDVRAENSGLSFSSIDGLTIRQSEVLDSTRDGPRGGGDWGAFNNRNQGIFAKNSEGLLIEETLVSHSGWEKGYDVDGDGNFGQPPSMFSQNIYIQKTSSDVTFRGNISMEAASAGAQIRPGGLIEDNAFIDNNFGFSSGHGKPVGDGTFTGNFTTANGNLVTSGAHKVAKKIGALTMGISDYSKDSVYTDNIVAHLANPDDADEQADKRNAHRAINDNDTRLHDDTVVYNWEGSKKNRWGDQDQNVEGLDPETMDVTTIQRYVADLLGQQTATIEDFSDYLRALTASGAEIDVKGLLDYFRDGFGVEVPDHDGTAQAHTFVPSELADGVRWDNRLNWDGEVLPMDGDSVDLNGAFVHFGGSLDIAALDLGPGGTLVFDHGYLGVDDLKGGGDVDIDGAGQFWLEGWDGEGVLDIDLDGGRFANDGDLSGAIALEADEGQAILAIGGGSMVVEAGGTIAVSGDDAKVGFDGEGGTAALRLEAGATLAFVAEAGGLGTLSEFRSGAFEGSDVISKIDLADATLAIDVSALAGGGVHDLVVVDALDGRFGAVTVTGLGDRDASVHVATDTGKVTLVLTAGGSGRTEVVDAPLSDAARAEAGAPSPVVGDDAPKARGERMTGSDEADAIDGTLGNDRLHGGEGDDALRGHDGNDRMSGGGGDDLLSGGTGRDRLSGGAGDDELRGDDGRDVLNGGDGDDLLLGGLDRDSLKGGAGVDTLMGGEGTDRLDGQDGDDILMGGLGHDRLTGGAGADQFVFDVSTDGRDRDDIQDFDQAQGDLIVIQGLTSEMDVSLDFHRNRASIVVETEEEAFRAMNLRTGYDGLELIERGDDYAIFG